MVVMVLAHVAIKIKGVTQSFLPLEPATMEYFFFHFINFFFVLFNQVCRERLFLIFSHFFV